MCKFAAVDATPQSATTSVCWHHGSSSDCCCIVFLTLWSLWFRSCMLVRRSHIW